MGTKSLYNATKNLNTLNSTSPKPKRKPCEPPPPPKKKGLDRNAGRTSMKEAEGIDEVGGQGASRVPPARPRTPWSRASQTCVLLDLSAAAGAARGGAWSSHEGGGGPQTLLDGLDLHAIVKVRTCCPAPPRRVTSVIPTLNSIRTPWMSHLSVATNRGGGGGSSKVAGAPPLYSPSSCSVQEVL